MIWRSTAMIVVAFVAAWMTVEYSPILLDLIGLGEFVFIGQVALPILVLSVLEIVFRRISGPTGPGFIHHGQV
ncbi:MAG TPA: hypothetical protein VHX39_11115 [Acetobacteraceae bacterium]|nr:hypothetical protein [Acetobacteraceae bacterium]